MKKLLTLSLAALPVLTSAGITTAADIKSRQVSTVLPGA